MEKQTRGKGTRIALLHLSQLSLYLCSDILAKCLVDIQWLTSCLLHDVNIVTSLSDSGDSVTNLLKDRTELLLLFLVESLLVVLSSLLILLYISCRFFSVSACFVAFIVLLDLS